MDYVEHEGKKYRKVTRKAQVGELVLTYQGNVRRIERIDTQYGAGTMWTHKGTWLSQNESQYVVLEPLTDETPTNATDDPIFASLAQLPKDITLSDVYEVYARGKRAMAQESFEAEEIRFKRDRRRLIEALHGETDMGAADGYWALVRSHYEKMTYWRKEIEKWDSEIERCKSR